VDDRLEAGHDNGAELLVGESELMAVGITGMSSTVLDVSPSGADGE
jgi:hypothetical protein